MVKKTDINVTIGKNIRHRRKLANLSQEFVAKRMGYSYQQQQKYETGSSSLTCEKAIDLAKLLGCAVEHLLGDATRQASPLKEPEWNAFKVTELMQHFSRIKSRTARTKVTQLVKTVADVVAVKGKL